MHFADDLDCTRGYEFWLASQAKLRNPHIRICEPHHTTCHPAAPTASSSCAVGAASLPSRAGADSPPAPPRCPDARCALRCSADGLPWGFPHWLAPTPDGTGNPLNETNAPNTVKYIANWVSCARSHWNLTIDFLGPWNEKDDQFASSGMFYLRALRKELDSRGFQSTKLV